MNRSSISSKNVQWQKNFPIPPRNLTSLLDTPYNQYRHQKHDLNDSLIARSEDVSVRSLGRESHTQEYNSNGHRNSRDYRANDNILRNQSLLTLAIVPPTHLVNNNSENKSEMGNFQRRRKSVGGAANQRNFANRNQQHLNRRKSQEPKTTLNGQQMTESEKKAMETEVSQEFFDRVKPLSLMQLSNDVALEFARREIAEKGLNENNLLNKGFVSGNFACKICRQNFEEMAQLTNHYMTEEHKELEVLFALKKDQARLIMQKKINQTHVTPDPDIVAISRAEVEMNLKPKEMELDPYILGVYESIMKPYWPSPSTTFYCRICNYKEFKSEEEHTKHNNSREHQEREETYEDAFCLFCQIHNKDANGKKEHDKTEDHIKIKDLMNRSKINAVDHWHKVNELPLPDKFKALKREVANKKAETALTVGVKRSAPEPDQNSLKSPLKKVANAETMSNEKEITLTPKSDVALRIEKNLQISEFSSHTQKNNKSNTNNNQELIPGKETVEKQDLVGMQESNVKKNISQKPELLNHSVRVEKFKIPLNSNANNNNTEKKDAPLLPREKVWFIPVKGFMCAACHVFVEEKNQRAHLREIIHTTSVLKFRRQMNS